MKLFTMPKRIFSNVNVKNSAWSMLDVLIYPALFLSFTPFFIDQLGENLFGIWMFFNTVLITFNFLSYGIHESAVFLISRAIGKKDHSFITSFTGSLILLSLLTGLVVAAILSAVNFIGLQSIFTSMDFAKTNTSLILFLLIGIFLLRSVLQVFFGLFKAFERFEYSAGGNSIVRLSSLIGAIFLVWKGGSIEDIFRFQLIIYCLGTVALYGILSQLSGIKYELKLIVRHFRQMFHYAKWFWSQALIGMLSLQADRYLVAYFSGAIVLGYYSIVSTIFNHIHMAYEALALWIFPKISKWKAQQLPVEKLYKSVQAIIGFIGLSSLVVFSLSEHELLLLWLGAEKYGQLQHYVPFFILYEIFYLNTIVKKFYLNGINKIPQNTLLEYAYKIMIIAVFSIVFYQSKDILMMLKALSITTAIAISLYVYAVNHLTRTAQALKTTFLDLMPSALIFLGVFQENRLLSILFFAIAIIPFDIHRKKYLNIEVLRF